MSLKSLLVPKLRDVEFLKTNPAKIKIYIKVRLESEQHGNFHSWQSIVIILDICQYFFAFLTSYFSLL